MQGSTHLIWGIVAGTACADWSDPSRVIIAGAVGGIAALVPDWLQVNIPGASRQIKGAFGHRGFSHWAWIALAVGYGLHTLGAPLYVTLAAMAGWLSHILLDALAYGVPAFWPLGRVTLGHVKTGGKLDTLVGATALVMMAVIIGATFIL